MKDKYNDIYESMETPLSEDVKQDVWEFKIMIKDVAKLTKDISKSLLGQQKTLMHFLKKVKEGNTHDSDIFKYIRDYKKTLTKFYELLEKWE